MAAAESGWWPGDAEGQPAPGSPRVAAGRYRPVPLGEGRGCGLVTDRGLEALSGHPRLQRLRLNRCDQITDSGLASLANVRTLVDLDLSWCTEITDVGLGHLRTLPALARVNLQGCDRATPAGRSALHDVRFASVTSPDNAIFVDSPTSTNVHRRVHESTSVDPVPRGVRRRRHGR